LADHRLTSLDAFRGLTIAGMIIVNNPGSWEFVYAPLRHAEWHGWTPTDLIFPFFLFIVGVSMTLSLSWHAGEGESTRSLYLKMFKRAVLMFSLGAFLHLFPHFHFSTMRVPGVLQRIAVCTLFGALIDITVKDKGRAAAAFLALAGYWLLMKLIPVPGYGPGVLDYNGNLCGYIDTKLMAGHLYKPEFDPEGLLSTIPAVATVLLGTLVGDWLRSKRGDIQKKVGLLAGGTILAAAGLFLQAYFPINKQLWTPTYVLFTGGVAALLFGLFHVLMDGMRVHKWATPFIVFGTNSILAYAGSTLLVKVMALIKVTAGGKTMGLQPWIYRNLFVPWAGNLNGSLAYAVFYTLLWLMLLIPLYRKKVFIRI